MLPKTLTTGDAFSKFVSSPFFSLKDFKYFVDTISLPNGKKLYLIAGHRNGNNGKSIIPPKRYSSGTKNDVTSQIIFPKKAIVFSFQLTVFKS
jgi:hypothetical protein